MPFLHLRLSGAEAPAVTHQVCAMVTELTAAILGKKRELIAVVVEHVDEECWIIGGISLPQHGTRTFFLEIKITEGTNTKHQKAEYVRQVFLAMESVLGELHPASYIIIHDVNADSWGYGGKTQEFRHIRQDVLMHEYQN